MFLSSIKAKSCHKPLSQYYPFYLIFSLSLSVYTHTYIHIGRPFYICAATEKNPTLCFFKTSSPRSKRIANKTFFLLLSCFVRRGDSEAASDHNMLFELAEDWNGIKHAVLRNAQGASARVCLHGGQVVSWRNNKGEELLFTSNKAIFKPPKAMRGGISVCFPQFGNCGIHEQHGFIRNKMWIIDDNPPPLHPNESCGRSFVDLLLRPDNEDLKCWPHAFEFCLRVSLGSDGNLLVISRIRNVHEKSFSFSFAYHTYLSVSDICEVRIEGLETLDYLDNLCGRKRFTDQGDAITFESELDRIYTSSPACVAVLNHGKKRTCVMRKDGLPDFVVWNPWEKKAKTMVDIGDEEYKEMVSVDAAAVEKKITLKPGEEWTGRIELVPVPSSFCTDGLEPRFKFF